jgi:hypothetical protein
MAIPECCSCHAQYTIYDLITAMKSKFRTFLKNRNAAFLKQESAQLAESSPVVLMYKMRTTPFTNSDDFENNLMRKMLTSGGSKDNLFKHEERVLLVETFLHEIKYEYIFPIFRRYNFSSVLNSFNLANSDYDVDCLYVLANCMPKEVLNHYLNRCTIENNLLFDEFLERFPPSRYTKEKINNIIYYYARCHHTLIDYIPNLPEFMIRLKIEKRLSDFLATMHREGIISSIAEKLYLQTNNIYDNRDIKRLLSGNIIFMWSFAKYYCELIIDCHKTNVRKIVSKCRKCTGYILKNNYTCDLCGLEYCKKCVEPLEKNHTCTDTASVQAILKDSHPCPTCGERISKIEGCNQMFCVMCHTGFWYGTNEIIKTAFHNPHRQEFLARNPGFIQALDCNEYFYFPDTHPHLFFKFYSRIDIRVSELVTRLRTNIIISDRELFANRTNFLYNNNEKSFMKYNTSIYNKRFYYEIVTTILQEFRMNLRDILRDVDLKFKSEISFESKPSLDLILEEVDYTNAALEKVGASFFGRNSYKILNYYESTFPKVQLVSRRGKQKKKKSRGRMQEETEEESSEEMVDYEVQ